MFGAEADAPWTKEEDLAIIMQAEQREAREWVKVRCLPLTSTSISPFFRLPPPSNLIHSPGRQSLDGCVLFGVVGVLSETALIVCLALPQFNRRKPAA